MTDRVKQFLKDLRQASSGQHFALGVSGGGDSMGLLALAAQAKKYKDAPQFSVLSVDHGLRAEASAEIDNVAAACAKFGLPHWRLSADDKLADGDVQQQARNLRYRLMAQWVAQHKVDGVVCAHHQQDQAETVLMRLSRGSGVNGLSGMAARQVLATEAGKLIVLRPLINWSRDGVRQAALDEGLRIADDPSNQDRRFERVRWRQALPQLAECGLSVDALNQLADEMRIIRRSLDGQLLDWLAAHAYWHEYGVLCIARAAYLDLSLAMQNRLISAFTRFLGSHDHPLKRSALATFSAHPAKSESGAATLGGSQMRWRKATVFLGREAAACHPKALAASAAQLWDNRFFLTPRMGVEAGYNVAGLGAAGVQVVRDRGGVFDNAVPACYHAGLAGIFDADGLVACPIIDQSTDFQMSSVYSDTLFRDVLSSGQAGNVSLATLY